MLPAQPSELASLKIGDLALERLDPENRQDLAVIHELFSGKARGDHAVARVTAGASSHARPL